MFDLVFLVALSWHHLAPFSQPVWPRLASFGPVWLRLVRLAMFGPVWPFLLIFFHLEFSCCWYLVFHVIE